MGEAPGRWFPKWELYGTVSIVRYYRSADEDCRPGTAVELAAWTKPRDIRSQYASASFLADSVVIFSVKGNAYRLEVAVAYRTGIVSIRWAGTHREYDQRNRKR